MRVRGGKVFWSSRLGAISIAVLASLVMIRAVSADFIVNNIDITWDPAAESLTIAAGGSTSVGFFIASSNLNPAGDPLGCNVTALAPATVTLAVPAAVSASTTSLTFTGCGPVQSVVFSSNTPGTHPITVAGVSGGVAGSGWDTSWATFNLTVLQTDFVAPNTAIALSPALPNGDNGWYRTDVHVTISALDNAGGSGLAQTRCLLDPVAPPASFDAMAASCAYTGAGGDVGAAGSHVVYAASRDVQGNTESPVKSATFKIDRTPPTITCGAAPVFVLNQSGAMVSAGVSDAGSGPVVNPVSQSVSTAAIGSFVAVLSASDNAGNTATLACGYSVRNGDPAYLICPLFDGSKPHKAGSTIPIKIQLCDARGSNLSSAGINVSAVGITMDGVSPPNYEPAIGSGAANPDNRFRYSPDLAGYIYTLKTNGLREGSWRLWFTVGTDPSLYSVSFRIK